MKALIVISITLLFSASTGYAQVKTYKLVKKTNDIPGDVDSAAASKLNEPLRALAGLYSAMGGTMCNGETCELTTALGLGKQGSEAHKSLIKKYFPDDKVAAALILQDCYLRPSGASTFSDYEYLTISYSRDTARVSYSLSYYMQGETSFTKGTDVYVFRNNVFKKVRRKLWVFADK